MKIFVVVFFSVIILSIIPLAIQNVNGSHAPGAVGLSLDPGCGGVEFTQHKYFDTDFAIVEFTKISPYFEDDQIDSHFFKVWSDSDPEGITVQAQEVRKEGDLFRAYIGFHPNGYYSSTMNYNYLEVSENDVIYADPCGGGWDTARISTYADASGSGSTNAGDYDIRIKVERDKEIVQVGDTIKYTVSVYDQSPPNDNLNEFRLRYLGDLKKDPTNNFILLEQFGGTANGKENYVVSGFYQYFGYQVLGYSGFPTVIGGPSDSIYAPSSFRCVIGTMKSGTSATFTVHQTVDPGQSDTVVQYFDACNNFGNCATVIVQTPFPYVPAPPQFPRGPNGISFDKSDYAVNDEAILTVNTQARQDPGPIEIVVTNTAANNVPGGGDSLTITAAQVNAFKYQATLTFGSAPTTGPVSITEPDTVLQGNQFAIPATHANIQAEWYNLKTDANVWHTYDGIFVVGFDNMVVNRYHKDSGNPFGTGKFLTTTDGLDGPYYIIANDWDHDFLISNYGSDEIQSYSNFGLPIPSGGTIVPSGSGEFYGPLDDGTIVPSGYGGLDGPLGLAVVHDTTWGGQECGVFVNSYRTNKIIEFCGQGITTGDGVATSNHLFVTSGPNGPRGIVDGGEAFMVANFNPGSSNSGKISPYDFLSGMLPEGDFPSYGETITNFSPVSITRAYHDPHYPSFFVTSWNENKVYKYDPVLKQFEDFVSSGSAGLKGPIDLKFDPACKFPDGQEPCYLYVASYRTNEVLRYDGITGQPAPSPNGPGKFIQANSLVLDGPTGIEFGWLPHVTALQSSSGGLETHLSPVPALPPDLKGKYVLPQLTPEQPTTQFSILDFDRDGILDYKDNCPKISNRDQSDRDRDGIGDACDPTPKGERMVPTKQIIVPSWIKTNAGWWADGQISDESFVEGIKYLIKEDIMRIPQTRAGTGTSQEIPSWIKTNAEWWSQGQISDESFVNGIQWLIENGIMKIG